MRVLARSEIDEYLRDDWVLEMLSGSSERADDALGSQRWLRQNPPKRCIVSALYGDLLRTRTDLDVLDVGGGLSSLTRVLTRRHRYVLNDLLAHDRQGDDAAPSCCPDLVVHAEDWYEFLESGSNQQWDVIIANDLFPNVDQRLPVFVERALPACRMLRMSLTFFDHPHWYRAHREDAEEIFHMMMWTRSQLVSFLRGVESRIHGTGLDALEARGESVFENGRQVCILSITGDLGT